MRFRFRRKIQHSVRDLALVSIHWDDRASAKVLMAETAVYRDLWLEAERQLARFKAEQRRSAWMSKSPGYSK